eukprot:CAMPEP_0113584430 /NCGR_PEP_ID=MMETSP0015_2-20120614/33107_1 /TAXON_ID=2838 /ORGANISM="Odontella" /LENGTH=495 /DNA_ID=CAMNT_0000489495 /DNA_START=70 /DNA_END=1554 /DNA_ORIENTATION=+ /assembly_acc=CAM_ASM_000160
MTMISRRKLLLLAASSSAGFLPAAAGAFVVVVAPPLVVAPALPPHPSRRTEAGFAAAGIALSSSAMMTPSTGEGGGEGEEEEATATATFGAAATTTATDDRRSFLSRGAAAAFLLPAAFDLGVLAADPRPASARVYFDPAMYGDQELRGSAVNSLKEAVRRAVLQRPSLAPSFYQLAILDGLSFDAKSGEFGPDGSVVRAVLNSKDVDSTPYMSNLKESCEILIKACRDLRRLTSITIGDAVALGGTAAIESIGGPFLSVQLGRTEPSKSAPISPLDLRVLSGESSSPAEVYAAFERSGLTSREMTAILGTLLTLDSVQKTRSAADWKRSARPKFREPGKIGRASDFRPLTEQDIADLESDDYNDDDDDIKLDGDEDWYIAETFGTRDEQFGSKVGGGDISEKNFNKFIKELNGGASTKKSSSAVSAADATAKFGWIGAVLLDANNPTAGQWVNKYAGSYLNYNRDLSIAYNAVTQLGAEYTGGKYESLLKNRKR